MGILVETLILMSMIRTQLILWHMSTYHLTINRRMPAVLLRPFHSDDESLRAE